MGFRPSMRQAADESNAIGFRYIAFRNALTHSHLGFHQAWAIAESKFGLIVGEQADSKALKNAAEFFLMEREAWISYERARIAYIRRCKSLGLSSPTFSITRYWG